MNRKRKEGITLIALVITIIVLLILAGISIAMLSGENSILSQAGRARDITGEKSIAERVQIAYLGALVKGNGNVERTDLLSELQKEFGNKIVDSNIASDLSKVTIDGKDYYFDGTVTSGGNPPGESNLTDGEKTKLASNGIAELTGDAITNNNLKDTTKIKAVITGQVPIPDSATYEGGTVDTGVVIKYKNSEFVWVPVPVTAGNDLYVKGTTKPMARVTSGTDANGKTNYQGVLYNYSGTGDSTTSTENTSYGQGTTSTREPDIVTGNSDGTGTSYDGSSSYYSTILGYSSASDFKTDLQQEYNKMIESVSKYGGFFVGRYETSYNTSTSKVESVADVVPSNADNTNTNKWYGLYQKQKNFTESTDKMVSSMIWGSQYDAMLNWALTGTDKSHVTATSNATHNNTYNATTIKTRTTTETTDSITAVDKINNIYDLEGNLLEWTQEANTPDYRVCRGGYYSLSISPKFRNNAYPYNTDTRYGSRLSLYIK